ncbi:hypothetical protein [Marivita hallyeonensis]|uniref:Polyisoprenoid-binding protein YceI n=1 Tax=Marivita hallyeonensis TaxID=996342 RepID=A0A1M5M002_9RHOB|nr:hypothetical protein [Marivita hallyeonensis]SHG70674.1 hypothetical protein SAMN05443551_0347 [Marivita hallyeonensis]
MAVLSGLGFARALQKLCLGASLLAATVATATESGYVTLTLGNEQFELPLNAAHSDWTGSPGFAKVSILSRPTEVATWERFQSLRLAFDLLRTGATTPELSLLRRRDDAGFERWYGRSESGGLTVVITERSLNDTELTVSGSFTGTLGRSDNFGQTIDLSEPMPVSGRFEVTLLPIR